MRRRLVLAIAGVAAGAIVLFAIPLAVSLRQVYRDEDLIRLERDTIAATRAIDLGAAGGDPIELPRTPDRRAVYDAKGHLRAGSADPGDAALARATLRNGRPAVRSQHGRLVVAVPLLSGERVRGALVAERSADAATDDTRRAWLLLGALAGVVLLAAIAAALLLGRGLARPLERLAASARRLGHGDFSVRAPRSAVPEVDAVAAALDATAARLDELVSRERAFSADASHQLRTPLAALRIELEAAQLRGEDADPELALGQVDRLEQTIETLLSVARDAPQDGGEADLSALADELESQWRARLAAAGRPVRVELDRGPLLAIAHEPVVREVLEVLLDNAFRHGRGAVTISVRHRGGWVVVDVADEGPGFGDDPDVAFERGAAGSGHGIGLALARSLAHAEGGRLSVDAPGPRPVVSLTLRAVAERGDQADRSETTNAAEPGD